MNSTNSLNGLATAVMVPRQNTPTPPATPAPAPPTDLTATAPSGQVVLSWTDPTDTSISKYQFRITGSYDDTDNPQWPLNASDEEIWTYIDPSSATTITHTITALHDNAALTDGTAYTVELRAVNTQGNGGSARVGPVRPGQPDPPTGLTNVARTAADSLEFSWTAPTAMAPTVTGYQYRTRASGDFVWSDWQDVLNDDGSLADGSKTAYVMPGLAAGTTYSAEARSMTGTDPNRIPSGPSNTATGKTADPLLAPAHPTRLRATPGDGAVTLTWIPPSIEVEGVLQKDTSIVGYKYLQSTDGGENFAETRLDVAQAAAAALTMYTLTGLTNGQPYTFALKAQNTAGLSAASNAATARPLIPEVIDRRPPRVPRNLTAVGGDGEVMLSWSKPARAGRGIIRDYEYRINGTGRWISTGSTRTTHTVTGLVNGTSYVFEVRAVNRFGTSRASNRAEVSTLKPQLFALDFAHFTNGASITSDLVFVNVAPRPVRPAIYFYDTQGDPIGAESVVDVTGDLEIREDGALTVRTEMEPLGVLTISTHGRGALVSGSVKVVSEEGPIGGMIRYDLPAIGEAVVGASPPVRDAIFPAHRQEGGIRTAAALHNVGEEPIEVSCRLMSGGVLLEEVKIPLEANGQTSWFIEEAFTGTDTSDFLGSVHCTAPGREWFTAIAVEMDADQRSFTALPVVTADRTGGGGRETVLDFAHFANGSGITSDFVFVNVSTQSSGPPLSPFHPAIPPSLPALYFYDQGGDLIDPESVVDLTGDLEVREDGSLTVRAEMEPLGVLTIATHGRGELVSGSVKVVSSGPLGGMLRYNLPEVGVGVAGSSPPLSDALFPVRRQEGGITTGIALHNLESSPGLARCELLREGVLLDAVSIPLEANGQTSWLIDKAFPAVDTSNFVGAVRCDAVGEGRFTAVALEMDSGTRTFITLPVFPLPEMPSAENGTP